MVDPVLLLAFIPAGLALNLTPGADMMFCLGQGLRAGPRAALAASAGISLGAFVHTALAGLGLGALVAAVPLAFEVIRWVGVAYLLWLAVQTLRHRPGTQAAPHAPRRAFRAGLMVHLSHPKVILFVLAFVPQFVDPTAGPVLPQFLIFGALLALAITSWIAMKSLLQPQLFRDVDRRLLSLSPDGASAQNSDLTRLLDYVDTEQPYLDPELTLARLSDQLALTPREVSELLNQSLGVHFFDFVNGHRIAHAQKQLIQHPKQSILEVLLESGFNSKSSFNTAFKKHAGMTPSAFRKQGKS